MRSLRSLAFRGASMKMTYDREVDALYIPLNETYRDNQAPRGRHWPRIMIPGDGALSTWIAFLRLDDAEVVDHFAGCLHWLRPHAGLAPCQVLRRDLARSLWRSVERRLAERMMHLVEPRLPVPARHPSEPHIGHGPQRLGWLTRGSRARSSSASTNAADPPGAVLCRILKYARVQWTKRAVI